MFGFFYGSYCVNTLLKKDNAILRGITAKISTQKTQ